MKSTTGINAILLVALLMGGCQTIEPVPEASIQSDGNRFSNGYYRSSTVTDELNSGLKQTSTVNYNIAQNRIEDSYSKTNGWSNFIVYQHDEQGRLLSRVSRNSRTTTYLYNKKGLPEEEVRKYNDGQTRRTNYKWNIFGNLYQSTQNHYNSKNTLTDVTQFNYQYDDEQRLVKRECKDIKLSGRPCLIARYTVDDTNRIIERKLYDSKHEWFLGSRTFDYDENGNLVRREYYDAAGKLTARSTISFTKASEPVVNRYLFKYAIDP